MIVVEPMVPSSNQGKLPDASSSSHFRRCGGSGDVGARKSFLVQEKASYGEFQRMWGLRRASSLERILRTRNHRRSRNLEELPHPTKSFVRCRGSKDARLLKV